MKLKTQGISNFMIKLDYHRYPFLIICQLRLSPPSMTHLCNNDVWITTNLSWLVNNLFNLLLTSQWNSAYYYSNLVYSFLFYIIHFSQKILILSWNFQLCWQKAWPLRRLSVNIFWTTFIYGLVALTHVTGHTL